MPTRETIASPLESSRQRLPHRPALTAVIAFATGILLDHAWSVPLAFWFFTAGAVLASTFWLTFRGTHPRLHSVLIFLLVLLTGGIRHHLVWTIPETSSVNSTEERASLLVDLRGVLKSPVEILDRPVGPRIPSWMELDRSTALLEIRQILVDDLWQSSTGTARIEVAGHLTNVEVGDQIEVLGQLSFPRPPSNPGEANFGTLLKMQGADFRLSVNHPAAVQKQGEESGLLWTLARWRSAIRKECQNLMSAELRPPVRGLASSLLIGDRSQLTDQLKDQFAETGMMHLLAISGINVGILMGMVYFAGRMFNLSSVLLAIWMIAAALIFTWIADHQASVIRAGLLAILGLIGSLAHRAANRWNTLAACALILLVWNPLDLFDIGAQLSFLAVSAIFWATGIPVRKLFTRGDEVPVEHSPRMKKWIDRGFALVKVYFVSGAVWVATVPLTMATFHLLTPIGLLGDLILVPCATVVLGLGYLFLTVGLLSPWLASWIAIPFNWGLQLMQLAVAWGQQVPGGHFFVPELPGWWVMGFYLFLALAWLRAPSSGFPKWGIHVLPAWIILGLMLPFWPRGTSPLRCTFLSVGHGLACVVEAPDGSVILYDAGTIGDGRRAHRAVERLLRYRSLRTIDTIVLSHADHDHFSGMFELLERFPVRQLCLSPQSARSTQSGIQDLLNAAMRQGVPVRMLQQGDSLNAASTGVEVEVLHPAGDERFSSDNEQSLVLKLKVAQRSVLLTGDIERSGLTRLMQLPTQACDVVLSPHHGGKQSNNAAFFEWASPKWIMVSGGPGDLKHIQEAAANSTVLSTAASGATTFLIHPNGEIKVETFLDTPSTGEDD